MFYKHFVQSASEQCTDKTSVLHSIDAFYLSLEDIDNIHIHTYSFYLLSAVYVYTTFER